MIRLQDLTPAVYYEQSRDFQFMGRLYDVVLNSIKTNATNLYNLPAEKNMDEQLLNLLALTLGFKPTKNYNSKQLLAICSVLPTILKYKGSIQAMVLATNALLAAEGVKQPLDYTLIPKQGITLYVAQELEDLNLFTDLLDYLLPAGLSCNIIKESQLVATITTTFGVTNTVIVHNEHEGIGDGQTYYGTDELGLSTIAPKHRLAALSIGEIKNAPSVLANTTIMKKPGSDSNFAPEHPPALIETSQSNPIGEINDEH
jgi:hypothetical protein